MREREREIYIYIPHIPQSYIHRYIDIHVWMNPYFYILYGYIIHVLQMSNLIAVSMSTPRTPSEEPVGQASPRQRGPGSNRRKEARSS